MTIQGLPARLVAEVRQVLAASHATGLSAEERVSLRELLNAFARECAERDAHEEEVDAVRRGGEVALESLLRYYEGERLRRFEGHVERRSDE